ncbi:MAG: hypothetical protein RIT81_17755 [Deltaproteobacteria bacterium]
MPKLRKRRRRRRTTAPAAGAVQGVAPTAAEAGVAAAAAAAGHNAAMPAAEAALRAGERAINAMGRRCSAQLDSCLGGRIAEEVHAATFNANAHLSGAPTLTARTTASVGRPSAAADIELLRAGRIVDGAQLKYSRFPGQNAQRLSRADYRPMQKVAPSDQLAKTADVARRLEQRNALRRPARAAELRDTAERVTDRITHDGVTSEPLTFDEAQGLARASRKGAAKLPRPAERSVGAEIAATTSKAAVAGLVAGGAVTAATSAFTNVRACMRGEKTGADAAKSVCVDTSVGALDGASKAALGAALKSGGAALAKSAAPTALKQVGGALGRSNAAFAIGACVVDATVGGVRLARGEIDGTEYGKRVGESTSAAAGGWGGAAGGAALGTMIFPGAGTAVGAVIGGIGGAVASSALFSALFD